MQLPKIPRSWCNRARTASKLPPWLVILFLQDEKARESFTPGNLELYDAASSYGICADFQVIINTGDSYPESGQNKLY